MIRYAAIFLTMMIPLLAGTSISIAKHTTTPAIGAATENFFNAAGAPTMKLYADASGEVYGYTGELLSSITLARGGAIALAYSDDGAKDLTSATWPAMQSGPFMIVSMTEAYGTDRAGRRNFIGDGSGGRALVFQNGRLVNTIYNSGLLQGYEIIPGRDTAGRHTGTMLKRYGNTIHTTEKALNGVSNQILDLASGGIIATPQRDVAGNITGYVWSDGTNTVSQTWQRGPGGRIEAASNDVPGAPQFTYLLDPNDPEESFDGFGRRLKSQTAGGVWEYTYGIGGQLTSASHPTLGTFTYQFDEIGRRTDMGKSNTTDILNQTTAWTHDQAKTLTIKAHPDARVWFNGVELQNFTGQHQAALTPPGTEGGWVPWETLAVLEGAGDGAGNPPINPLASPDAKAEKRGAVWVPPTEESFIFDAAGNRESSAQWDIGWDAKNQLARIRTKNHDTAPQAYDIKFTYDSEGRRVQKHVIEFQNGTVASEKIITFVWDGWDLLYERHQLPSGLTLLERKYLWGPDIADGAAGGAGGLLLIRETKGDHTTEIIPLYDGTGHVIALTNLNKDLLAEYAFGPFGERIHATGPMANSNPWRWATKYVDEETGLYYFGKRFYDPITGQWLSREPLGESKSVNLYSYCHNDPVNKIDILGLAERSIGIPIEDKIALIESTIRNQQAIADEIGPWKLGSQKRHRSRLLTRIVEQNNELRILRAAMADGREGELAARSEVKRAVEIINCGRIGVSEGIQFVKPWAPEGRSMALGYSAGTADGSVYAVNNTVRGFAWMITTAADGNNPLGFITGDVATDMLDAVWTTDFRPVQQSGLFNIDPYTNSSYVGGAFMGGAATEFTMVLLPFAKVGSIDDAARLVGRAQSAANTPLTPSTFARGQQGSGLYPGVDRFRDITLKKGTIIYGGAPGQSSFYTTGGAIRRAGDSATDLFQGLQVAPHPVHGYRPAMTAYEVVDDLPAAFGRTLANPQNGAGGLPQIVIPNWQGYLRPIHNEILSP